MGSVFQGHHKLDALDVSGVLQCFGKGASVEITAQDTGLHRTTVGPLLDRLRMAACLVAEDQRAGVVFEHCQVGADESVVRKENNTGCPKTATRRELAPYTTLLFA